jgi:phosphoenolpyruvate carboxylase
MDVFAQNPYKLYLTREKILSDFYAVIASCDAIHDIKEQLIDQDELEVWADLSVLESNLSGTQEAEIVTDKLLAVLHKIEAHGYEGVDSGQLAAWAGGALDMYDPDPTRSNKPVQGE